MMINNISQLNEFVEKNRVKNTGSIIPALIKSKELVSAKVAKLLESPQSVSKRLYL